MVGGDEVEWPGGGRDRLTLHVEDVVVTLRQPGEDLGFVCRGLDGQDRVAAFDHARRGRRIINQNIILSLLIITALLPLALFGVLGLAAVVLVHEVAEVIVILNGLRAARTRTPRLES